MIFAIEKSPPGSLDDGLVMTTAYVDSLAGRGDCTFAIPHVLGEKPPLVILLHGVYGSHWSWPLQGRAGATLQTMVATGEIDPMVLAMPSDGLAGYGTGLADSRHGRFQEWVTNDVPAIASTLIGDLGPRRFIGGLSLGAWSALVLGMDPMFAGIASHSAITTPADLDSFAVGPPEEDPRAFGVASDLLSILTGNRLPPIYMDCGLQDPLLDSNRRLHKGLLEAGVSHAYSEVRGDHSWEFWSARLPASLRFFDQLAKRKDTA